MLSPHEVAALILIHQAPAEISNDRDEVRVLLERRLVSVERGSGAPAPVLTRDGLSLLRCVRGVRDADDRM
ncbi:hypothetical protein Bsp3421_000852 [Burkholderia sp. FERM BP-3421]|jgi:hypothetical protein|uniref:hypothetical protein n=1 Tax=Burkholderia sp. FERM BP-3421 TaxID=1494466 RepID=UPI002361D2BF|nr:hypothetical protein [Burkholderia sp. FERM BP-3421]WDD90964.1 hypothetical protein Bsp3421_000852 [Burkholderia sp. FERM BP-3421]